MIDIMISRSAIDRVKEHSINSNNIEIWMILLPMLGKPVYTKMDEFPENFRTAFDPPPAPFLEKNIAIFSANLLRRH